MRDYGVENNMDSLLGIVIVGVLIIFSLPFALSALDTVLGTHYSCDIFGWHNGKGSDTLRHDGASVHSRCSKCGKSVMQDSQGNWF